MIKYREVFSFEVKELILKGVFVRCLDRGKGNVSILNCMQADEFLEILEHDNSDNRFEFYIDEISEDNQ